MATTKYWRLKLKGDLTPDQVHEAVRGRAANILRVHTERGETHVYFSGTEEQTAPESNAVAKAEAGEAEEVSIDQVTKIG